MSTVTFVAGILLIGLPIAFNVAFAMLAARFSYPDILRRPTAEVLARFRAGGSGLVLLWWAFTMTAVLLAPLAVLVGEVFAAADAALVATGVAIGVLAAVVQFAGLVRWPFVVPFLARADAQPDASAARREAIDIVFQALNRYLGVAVGEHLGYLLTGAWTVLVGVSIIQSDAVPWWIGAAGIVIGAALAVCALEFVGRFEERGWSFASRMTPVAYIAWSVWLAAVGVAILL